MSKIHYEIMGENGQYIERNYPTVSEAEHARRRWSGGPGSYVVVVEDGGLRALNEIEEAEIEACESSRPNIMRGRSRGCPLCK
jgi:hypothetical protein